MINSETIQACNPELRELLEFSCFYLAAADGKFSSIEQDWMDQHFGEGSSTRLINHYLNVDWTHTFERIIGIIGHSLSDSERQFVANEVRDWLQAFIESDGIEEEEQVRLDEFYQWLEDAGLPKRPSSPPPPAHTLPAAPQSLPEEAPPSQQALISGAVTRVKKSFNIALQWATPRWTYLVPLFLIVAVLIVAVLLIFIVDLTLPTKLKTLDIFMKPIYVLAFGIPPLLYYLFIYKFVRNYADEYTPWKDEPDPTGHIVNKRTGDHVVNKLTGKKVTVGEYNNLVMNSNLGLGDKFNLTRDTSPNNSRYLIHGAPIFLALFFSIGLITLVKDDLHPKWTKAIEEKHKPVWPSPFASTSEFEYNWEGKWSSESKKDYAVVKDKVTSIEAKVDDEFNLAHLVNKLPKLIELNLTNTGEADAELENLNSLNQLKELKVLGLEGFNLENADFLDQFESLEILNLKGNPKIPLEQIANLKTKLNCKVMGDSYPVTAKWTNKNPIDTNGSMAIASDSNGSLFVAEGRSVQAIHLDTGKKLWSFTPANSQIKSLAVGKNNTVYVGADYVYALAGNTGTKQWTSESKAGDALAITPNEIILSTRWVDKYWNEQNEKWVKELNWTGEQACDIYALDPRTGKNIWAKQFKWEQGKYDVPFTHEAHLSHFQLILKYCAFIDRDYSANFLFPGPTLLSLDVENGETISIYQPEKGLATSAPVVGPDGMIYFGTQVGIHAVNKRLKKEIWDHKIKSIPDDIKPNELYDGSRYSKFIPELCTDGKTIYAASKKRVCALDIKTGRLLWENSVFDENCGSPSIGPDGNLYLGAGNTSYEDPFKRILVLSPADGSIIRSIHTGETLINLPVVMAKDRLYAHGQGATHSFAIQGTQSQEATWGTLGQNIRRTFCPENLAAKVMPPGKTKSWTYGESPKSINLVFTGKASRDVLDLFGKPIRAKAYEAGFKWTYTGMDIKDEDGNTRGTVTFDISKNRVSGVWIERNPLIPKDKSWIFGNSITDINNIYKQKSAHIITKVFGNPATSRISGNELVWTYIGLNIQFDGRKSGGAIEFYLQHGQVTKMVIPLKYFPWKNMSQIDAYYRSKTYKEVIQDFGKPTRTRDNTAYYSSGRNEQRRHWVYNYDEELSSGLTKGTLYNTLKFEVKNGIIIWVQ